MKTNFENIGGSYSQQGDYLLPNLMLLDEDQRQISVWAMRHRRYLKSSHRVLYYNLLTSGELYNYLADVERQAENLFEQTIKSESCALIFCEIECTNLASRPFGYPNGNFLVRDTLRPAFCIRL